MPSLKDLALSLLVATTAASLSLRRRSSNDHATAPLVANMYGTVFDVQATVGGQSFDLLVDSGSSDLYVTESGFTCIHKETGLELTEEDCDYDVGRTYEVSDTYEEITNQIVGITYGAGTASGRMVFEEVSIAGVTVPRQLVGIANVSTPMGDGVSSGLVGLGYPVLTSAHPDNITDNSTYWYYRLPYMPLLLNMWEQGLIEEPYFAHVLSQHSLNESGPVFGGYLSNHNGNYTSYQRTRSYWETTLNATIDATRNNTASAPFQAFFDSGNPHSYLPARIADPLNQLFSPPGVYHKELEACVVDCKAKPPSNFTFQLGGQVFTHDPADLIQKLPEGVCISAIGNSDEIRLLDDLQLNVTGVSFLKTVVSVFDIGKNEMRFSKLLEEVSE